MVNEIIVILGKAIIASINFLYLGSASTWPGHIALKINQDFIKDILKNSKTKIVIISGTNGKTTTGRLITSIIRENNKTYIQNKAGANLLNGLASVVIKGVSLFSFARPGLAKLRYDYLIFESDEYALPFVLEQMKPDYLICLNLFRDQLDRYGEIDTIAKKWQKSFETLTDKTTLLLNSDDPQISYLSSSTKSKAVYFGLDQKGHNGIRHGADSIYCPKCFSKLTFEEVHFSHLGNWNCPVCGMKRRKPDISTLSYYPLPGTYNRYNSLAAALFAKAENINEEKVLQAFKSFTPAFGRQEKLTYKGENIQIFLSKNPTSFNESLETIKELNGRNLLILLNDKIPDGLDVSWIWDINFEKILDKSFNIAVSGDRVYDMTLRLKYAGLFVHFEPDSKRVLNKMTQSLEKDESLFVLPNYSAMLDIRKILTGRKIL